MELRPGNITFFKPHFRLVTFLETLNSLRHKYLQKIKAVFSPLKRKQLSSQDLLTARFRHKKTAISLATIIITFLFCLSTGYCAVDFDGDDDQIIVADSASLDISGAAMSISVWIAPDFNQTTGDREHRIVDKNLDNAEAYRFMFNATEDDWRFRLFADGGVNVDTTGVTWTAGTWHHLACRYDGSDMYIYWDGVEEASASQTGNITTNNDTMLIGNNHANDGEFDGEISELAIWSSDIGATAITQLYESRLKGTPQQIDPSNLEAYHPLDDIPAGAPAKSNFHKLKGDADCVAAFAMSANNTDEPNLGTDATWGTITVLTDATTSTSTSTSRMEGTTSRDFESGNSDYLYQADDLSTDIYGVDQPISICAWIKRESDTGNNETIAANIDYGDGNWQYRFFINISDSISFGLSDDGNLDTSCDGATTISTGTWYYVAGVYNDTDIRVYVNGVLDSNGSSNPRPYTPGIFDGDEQFSIGCYFFNDARTRFFDGLIDEVMVFDRALSAAEVLGIYLTSAYNDLSGNGNHGTPQDGPGASASGMTQTGETVPSYPGDVLTGF